MLLYETVHLWKSPLNNHGFFQGLYILSAAAGKCIKSGGLKLRDNIGIKSSFWSPSSGSRNCLIMSVSGFDYFLHSIASALNNYCFGMVKKAIEQS
jgi:hypothetical protein